MKKTHRILNITICLLAPAFLIQTVLHAQTPSAVNQATLTAQQQQAQAALTAAVNLFAQDPNNSAAVLAFNQAVSSAGAAGISVAQIMTTTVQLTSASPAAVANLSAIVQATSNAVVLGAVSRGENVQAAIQQASNSAQTAAVQAGQSVTVVAQAASQGAVKGTVSVLAQDPNNPAAVLAFNQAVSSAGAAGVSVAQIMTTTVQLTSASPAAVANLSAIVQATSNAVVLGAVSRGENVQAAIQQASSSAVTAAVKAGQSPAIVAQAATAGAVRGAIATGQNVSVATQASSQGVSTAASAAGLTNVAALVTASNNGAAQGVQIAQQQPQQQVQPVVQPIKPTIIQPVIIQPPTVVNVGDLNRNVISNSGVAR